MIILDTCILIHDALTPAKLTPVAKRAIKQAEGANQLFCCDISLWEIAMLMQKKRLDVNIGIEEFLNTILESRQIQVLAINPEIAAVSVSSTDFKHFDPSDRLIAATTIHYNAKLITCDGHLQKVNGLSVIW